MAEARKKADFMCVTSFSLVDMCHCSPAKLTISTYLHIYKISHPVYSQYIDASSGTAVLALTSHFLVSSSVGVLHRSGHCILIIFVSKDSCCLRVLFLQIHQPTATADGPVYVPMWTELLQIHRVWTKAVLCAKTDERYESTDQYRAAINSYQNVQKQFIAFRA